MIAADALSALFPSRTPSRKDLAAADLDAVKTHFEIAHQATVEVRRHPRARNLTLRVNAATRKIIATIPKRASRKEASGFILANYAWIRDRLLKAPEASVFSDGSTVPFRGIVHHIRFAGSARRRGVVRPIDTETGPELQVHGEAEHCPRRLKDWLMKTAKIDLQTRVAHHAQTLGVGYHRISVRDQSSRWGSCSSSGTLSFSWRLILAPPEILDYVAAHEVAHLREMNHSPAFWRLVGELYPDYKSAERWLSTDGPDLHRYCPTHLM